MGKMNWPTSKEYDLAMLALNLTVRDPEIRQGALAMNGLGIRHYGPEGLYTSRYRVDNWMIRCFCSNPPQEPPDDISERYGRIAKFVRENQSNVPALLETHFIN